MTRKEANQQKTSSSSALSDREQKLIEALFLRLQSIYGHSWISAFRDEGVIKLAKKEWMGALKNYNPHTIKTVLSVCRKKHHLPPSLPQFIEHCEAEENRSHKGFYQPPKIIKASKETADKNLNQIFQILGRKRKTLTKTGEKQC